ncbi:hypothetical protein C0J52_01036 [Blattella germanica]|nr:hypothetical protein C0J52_01036 [Blattella germanica]
MQFRFNTEIESSIAWETLPYTKTHSQCSAVQDYKIGQWIMKQQMVLVVFLIVGSEQSIALEIISKDDDVFKMC